MPPAMLLALMTLAMQGPAQAPVPLRPAPSIAGEARGTATAPDTLRACLRGSIGQDYLPQPAIWRVADADTTIYLFGTMHMLPASLDWRSAQLDAIIARADALFTESGDQPGKPGAPAFAALLKSESHPPLLDRVKGKRRERLAAELATLPSILRKSVDRAPNGIAMLTIEVWRDFRSVHRIGPGADAQLEAAFRKRGVRAVALDDPVEIDRVMAGLPWNAEPLAPWIATFDQTPDERLEDYHRWARGERGVGKVRLPAEWERPLLIDRNSRWTDMIVERLKTPGVVLVAAGAGHFGGRHSVQRMLRKRGVEAVHVSPAGRAVRVATGPRRTAAACNADHIRSIAEELRRTAPVPTP